MIEESKTTEALTHVEREEIRKQLEKEKEHARQTLLAEGRKEYSRDLFFSFDELGSMMIACLDRLGAHGIERLHEMVENAAYVWNNRVYSRPEFSPITKDKVLNDSAIKYLLEPNHTLPNGIKKHSKLFKNIAILFTQAGFSNSEIKEMSQKIIANCPEHRAEEIMGWVKHIESNKNKRWEYNPREVNQVFEEAGL